MVLPRPHPRHRHGPPMQLLHREEILSVGRKKNPSTGDPSRMWPGTRGAGTRPGRISRAGPSGERWFGVGQSQLRSGGGSRSKC